MTKLTQAEREESLARLREWFPKGSTVYTVLRHVSRSGMMRHIGVIALQTRRKEHIAGHPSADTEVVILHPNYHAARVLGYAQASQNDGLKVGGAGMDMGFHVAYGLASALYGDGYALEHKWL